MTTASTTEEWHHVVKCVSYRHFGLCESEQTVTADITGYCVGHQYWLTCTGHGINLHWFNLLWICWTCETYRFHNKSTRNLTNGVWAENTMYEPCLHWSLTLASRSASRFNSCWYSRSTFLLLRTIRTIMMMTMIAMIIHTTATMTDITIIHTSGNTPDCSYSR